MVRGDRRGVDTGTKHVDGDDLRENIKAEDTSSGQIIDVVKDRFINPKNPLSNYDTKIVLSSCMTIRR